MSELRACIAYIQRHVHEATGLAAMERLYIPSNAVPVRYNISPNPAPIHAAQDKGLAAMERLDKSLDEFQALLEEKDKQEVPIKQQEALGFVGAVEEAMVKGFPYEVPKQYATLPQLKARPLRLPGNN